MSKLKKTTLTLLVLLVISMIAPMAVMAKQTQETIKVWWLEDAQRYGGDGTLLSTWEDDRIPPDGGIDFRITGRAYHGGMEWFYNYYPLEDFEASPLVIANGKFAAWARYTSPSSGLPILDKIRGKLIIDEVQETAYGEYVQYGYAFGDEDTVKSSYPNAVSTDEADMWHIGTTYYTVHGHLRMYEPRVRSNVVYNTEDLEYGLEYVNYRLIFTVCVEGVENYADIDYVKVTYPDETELLLKDEGYGWGYHPPDDGEYFEIVFVDEQITGDFTFEVADTEGNKAQITATLDEWLPPLEWVSPGAWAVVTGEEVTFDWYLPVDPIEIDYYEFRLGWEQDPEGEIFWTTSVDDPPVTYSELPYNGYDTYAWWVLAESVKGNSVHAVTKFTLQ